MWGIVGHTDGVLSLTEVRWPAPVRLLILTVGPEDLIAPHLRPRLAQSYQIPIEISPSCYGEL